MVQREAIRPEQQVQFPESEQAVYEMNRMANSRLRQPRADNVQFTLPLRRSDQDRGLAVPGPDSLSEQFFVLVVVNDLFVVNRNKFPGKRRAGLHRQSAPPLGFAVDFSALCLKAIVAQRSVKQALDANAFSLGFLSNVRGQRLMHDNFAHVIAFLCQAFSTRNSEHLSNV
jgi:hypothetical protein